MLDQLVKQLAIFFSFLTPAKVLARVQVRHDDYRNPNYHSPSRRY